MSNVENELKNKMVNKEEENKQQNKKAGGVFILVLIASAILGGFIGAAGVRTMDMEGASDMTTVLAQFFTNTIGVAAPFLLTALFVFTLIYSVVMFSKCKKRWAAEKDTNDDIFDELDSKLNNILGVIQVYTVLSYFLFSAAFYYALHVEGTVWFLMALLVFIADIVLMVVYQRKVVDFVKIMNPEKQGSVYDLKFQEKWIESCDELEKQMIWQCGFKAYQVTNNMCVLLWVVFTCGAMFLKISLWPVAIVSLFWLVLTVTYLAEGRKLEKKMSEK